MNQCTIVLDNTFLVLADPGNFGADFSRQTYACDHLAAMPVQHRRASHTRTKNAPVWQATGLRHLGDTELIVAKPFIVGVGFATHIENARAPGHAFRGAAPVTKVWTRFDRDRNVLVVF